MSRANIKASVDIASCDNPLVSMSSQQSEIGYHQRKLNHAYAQNFRCFKCFLKAYLFSEVGEASISQLPKVAGRVNIGYSTLLP